MEEWTFTVDDVPRLKEMYEQCMPYYEQMYEVRLRPYVGRLPGSSRSTETARSAPAARRRAAVGTPTAPAEASPRSGGRRP